MVQQCWLFSLFFLISSFSNAQDERYYRQILTGELPHQGKDFTQGLLPQFNVMGPSYRVDLNEDGIEETIQPQKRDGVDWIEIRDITERKLFEAKLLASGGMSSLYKIKLAYLSQKVKTLIFFLDEGSTQGRRFESVGRIFLLSYENNDFSTMKLTQGPHMFHEKEAQREQYWRRDYLVNVYDVNLDGMRDISINYNHVQRIFIYRGRGEWERH